MLANVLPNMSIQCIKYITLILQYYIKMHLLQYYIKMHLLQYLLIFVNVS